MKRIFPFLFCFFSVSSAAGEQPFPSVSQKVWRFKALLDGKEIGEHSFALERFGPQSKLVSSATFRVKVFFLTAYSYDHRADESWASDCLHALESGTVENSESSKVTLRREGDTFLAVGPKGELPVGSCPMTFAYWNPKILEQQSLLNPQTGEWLPVKITPLGEESLSVRGAPVKAERFRITAPKTSIDIWYARKPGSEEREWVGLESTTPEGYVVRYELL